MQSRQCEHAYNLERESGKDYVPWTKTSGFSSKGRATRIFSPKVGRIVHLHSDNQLRAFLMYEFCPQVLDIRESYPLLDAMEVIDDKANLKFDKFRDKETGKSFVLTTSFVLSLRDSQGESKYIARTIKNSTELNRKIVFENLEIQRRYWRARDIDWKVVTEKQLPKQVAKNILWVRETLLDDDWDFDKEQLSKRLFNYLQNNGNATLNHVLKLFDGAEGLAQGTGIYVFRYLIATGKIRVNMRQHIDTAHLIRDILG